VRARACVCVYTPGLKVMRYL